MKYLFSFLVLVLNLEAATYYVDFATGSDANNGTSTSTPWKHAPGMPNFSGSYSHVAGDQFIFKGGVTWDSTTMPWHITNDGSSWEVMDYYGVDQTWYAGASWTRPEFDAEGTTYALGDTRGNAIYVEASYVHIDNLKVWNQGITSSGFPTRSTIGLAATTGGNNYNFISNCEVGPWVVASSNIGKNGGIVSFSSGGQSGTIASNNVVVGPSFIDPSFITATGGGEVFAGGGIVKVGILISNDISRVNQGMWFPNTAIGNVVHDGGDSYYFGEHENACWPSSSATIDGNIIYNWTGGIVFFAVPAWGGADGTQYFRNNVAFNNTVNAMTVTPSGSTGAGRGKVYVHNNHFSGLRFSARTYPMGVIDIRNNIVTGSFDPAEDFLANTVVYSDNWATNSTGLDSASFFQPTSEVAQIYNQGADLSAFFTTDRLGVSRPQGAAWDIGPYEYVSGSADVTAPTISSVVATVGGQTSATVTWVTDELATTGLQYGTTASYGTTVTNTGTRLNHSLVISGLSAGTTYHFKVTSQDPSGNNSESSDATFTTDASNPVIAVYSDSILVYGYTNGVFDSTLTVSNAGTGTLSGSASVASPFSLPSVSSYSLAAGTTTNVTVRFSPTTHAEFLDTVDFTGGGGISIPVTGISYIPQSSSAIVMTNATLIQPAENAFTATNNYIYVTTQETFADDAATAVVGFEVTTAGWYKVVATVDAPNGGANSFFIALDGQPIVEPTSETSTWDIVNTTSGFESRNVTIRGNGTFDAPQLNPKTWYLDTGYHFIDVRGREANALLRSLALEPVFAASSGSGTRRGKKGGSGASGSVGLGF